MPVVAANATAMAVSVFVIFILRGIDVGSGLMIAPGVQVESKIGPLSHLKMNIRQKYFPGGTYQPVYFGVELIQSLPVQLW